MPDPVPPGSAPAPAPGPAKGLLTDRPPLTPWWHESYFWYGVFVVGATFFGLLMGWKIPDVDMPSGGGGGGYSSSGGGSSFGGK